MRALELTTLRDAGVRAIETARSTGWLTLEQACDAFLARKRVSGKRGPLTPAGIRHWEDSLRFWRTGRFSTMPLRVLRRDHLEDELLARAVEHATTARNETQGLKAVLKYAGSRGETFAGNLLTIEDPNVERKPRRALTAEELGWLAAHTDDRQARLVLFAGTVGCRSGELFTLTADRVDLDGRAIEIPAHLCKEKRDKTIDLTAEETELLREQLKLPHRQRSAFVFPRPLGSPWSQRGHFRTDVWLPALEAADIAWRRERDTSVSPYPGLTMHELRHTAISLMREAGVPAEYIAQRVGHSDGGALLMRTYRHTRRAEIRRALDELGTGLLTTLAGGQADVVELNTHRTAAA